MRIGLIGWYGHANEGDERMLYCIKRFFSDGDFFVTGDWSDARRKIDELNKCDYVLIGGGGLILRNIGLQADLIYELRRPFGLIGVSVEAHHRSMRPFLEVVKEKAEFLLVRDAQSREYLDNHSKVIVGPDLTFLYPFDRVNEVKNDTCGFNLRNWHYWKGELHGRFHNLMQRTHNRFPSTERSYPLSKWEPDRAVSIVKKEFKDVLPVPLYFEDGVTNDVQVLARYFDNVPEGFDANLLGRVRYLVAMRYHALVYAAQCGIPFISLSYQPKNVTFCRDIGLDVLSVDIHRIGELEGKIQYLKHHHAGLREHLLSYREDCSKDIQRIFRAIANLIRKVR